MVFVEKRAETVKGNGSGNEKESGNGSENENARESESGNGSERGRRTRSETEKKMRKMHMSEGSLKENSARKKLLIKSALKIGKSGNGRKLGNMKRRLKEKKKGEERWQRKLSD